jgi:hypothetical protein
MQDELETELPPVLANPVIKSEDLPEDFDAADAALREAANKVDHGEDIPTELAEKIGVKTEDKPERPRDELGRFTKTEAGEDIPEAERKLDENAPTEAVKAPVESQESEYAAKQREKKQREEERKARSWENLNREKEELAARRQELEQREQQFRQPQQQRQAPQPREYSSQQLWQAGEDFKTASREAFKRYSETGDETALDEFNKNDQLAEQAFANASEFYAVEQQEAQQLAKEQHNQGWVANMEAEIKAMPDLAKPDAPIAVELLNLLKTHGAVFQMLPDGFKQAREIAQLRLDAKEAPTLREQLKKAQEEVTRLNGLTSPTPGGIAGPPAKKTLENMSEAEADAFIRRAAQEFDSNAVH